MVHMRDKAKVVGHLSVDAERFPSARCYTDDTGEQLWVGLSQNRSFFVERL